MLDCKLDALIRSFAFEKKRFSCQHKSACVMWPLTLTLTLSTPWMVVYLGTIVCKFGHDPFICLREESIFVPVQKCPYHVTFDLDLDLEHTLDADLPGDHRVQVWSRYIHLRARRNDFRASTKVPVSRDLWPWPWALHADLDSIVCKFCGDPAICVQEVMVNANSVQVYIVAWQSDEQITILRSR